MLGAAWFRRQAQRRFVICRVGLRVHTERFGLSEDRGKPKPFMVSDKHWEWSSMPGYKTDWKALGGIKKGEKRNSRAQECLGCELSFSFLFPLFFFLPFPSSSSFVGKPSLSTNPLDSEVLMWQEAHSSLQEILNEHQSNGNRGPTLRVRTLIMPQREAPESQTPVTEYVIKSPWYLATSFHRVKF
ncbi:hypothetical protein D5F01_LYC22742 [Larimichthys crocea]|uniref:Uncharacterized protein n=1 Tax=Larimichthys crocea TaxID=215358 RepID=A0A6G0HJK1_LARCR|nr:hypothetical protein D5F01_LYC22742 [Larimichthys crocea]